jgi:hypothetical protein
MAAVATYSIDRGGGGWWMTAGILSAAAATVGSIIGTIFYFRVMVRAPDGGPRTR